MQEESGLTIQRILVALDASPSSLSALEATAELAASLGAELVGLFVEDVDLLQVAELPFTRTVGTLSANPQELDARMLERGLRASAARARWALESAAQTRGPRVRWSFRVTRGAVHTELLAAASEASLIGLGSVGWSPLPTGRIGATARAVISEARSPVLLLPAGTRVEAPVLVVYDGSPEAQKALSAAVQLAGGGELIVLLSAEDQKKGQRLREQAKELLERREAGVIFRSADASTLVQAVKRERSGVLVLPIRSLRQGGASLLEELGRLRLPTLLVR